MTKRRPAPTITLDEALADPLLLGAAIGDLASWSTWRVVLKATFGLPLSDSERETFASIAGDRAPPEHRVRELWAVVSRRGGKSRVAAAIATHLAALVDHRGHLTPGEVGYVLILAATQKQARVIQGYIRGFFEASPILKKLLDEVTVEEIRLTNGIVISVHTNNYRTVRGRTLLACLFDEVSFWRDEDSSSPDTETYRAVLPSLATTDGMLIGISSPYRKTGLLYQKHQGFFGVADPNVLVVQGSTQAFNPTIPADIMDLASRDDPESARAEWFGEFRSDLSTFLVDAYLRRCVDEGVVERAHSREQHYAAFVDVAGGTGTDSMTLAIAHTEGDTRVLDLLRERKPPFSPEAVVEEFAEVLKRYRISTVVGDRYAGDWPAEQFRNRGVNFQHSELTRSQIYLEFLPLVNSRSVALLDDARLISQFLGLERRTTGSGRDAVDHGPGGHDDLANVAAGALTLTPARHAVPSWAKSSGRHGELYAEPVADPYSYLEI